MKKKVFFIIDNEIKRGYTNFTSKNYQQIKVDSKYGKFTVDREDVSLFRDELELKVSISKAIKSGEENGLKFNKIFNQIYCYSRFDEWLIELDDVKGVIKLFHFNKEWNSNRKRGNGCVHKQKIFSITEIDKCIEKILQHDNYTLKIKRKNVKMDKIFDLINTNSIPKVKII